MKLNSFERTFPAMLAPADDPAPAPEPAPEPDPTPAPDLSFIPEEYRADGETNVEGFTAHYQDMVSRLAQHDEARAAIPENPEGYEFSLPDDIDYGELELPEDYQIQVDLESDTFKPLFAELGSTLHELGIPKEAAPKFMGLIAKYEAAKYARFHGDVMAGRQEMGTSFDSRSASVNRLLEARLPKDLAEEAGVLTKTARGVKALEKLLAPRSMATPNPQPKTEDLESLTPFERLKRINARQAG